MLNLAQLKAAVEAIGKWLFWYQKKQEHPEIVEPEPPLPEKPPMPAPIRAVLNPHAPYDWSTPHAACVSVRTICDEEGMSWDEKEEFAKTVNGESGFKNTAKNYNKDYTGQVVSTDWGIMQINDHYHIGKGKTFPSVAYILDNPEKPVRWAVKQFQAGHKDWWIAHKNGSYKKYPSKV